MVKQKAIIVDLDGTLFNTEHRAKYVDGSLGKKDWDKFYEGIKDDKLNEWCGKLVYAMTLQGYWPIFITGRSENHRGVTNRQSVEHGYVGRLCFMRPKNDFRPDYIIKEEIYNEHIKDKYDVLFAIDDRQQVIDMWRKIGITALQCAKGDF